MRQDSVVKEFFTTAADGKNYSVNFYALEMEEKVRQIYSEFDARRKQFKALISQTSAEFSHFLEQIPQTTSPNQNPKKATRCVAF